MHSFYTPVDKRSRQAMIDFLAGHFRYNTMNSWNQSTSYAHNMKLYNLGLESDIEDALYEMLNIQEFHDRLSDLRKDSGHDHSFAWQAGMNGRGGGYLVLYEGCRGPSGYKSYCTCCGQQNYTSVTETGDVCGVCRRNSRRDYSQTHMRVSAYPGRSIDMHEDFEDWPLYALRDRVELVQEFDRLADRLVQEAVYMAKHFEVKEEIYMVPQTRMVFA